MLSRSIVMLILNFCGGSSGQVQNIQSPCQNGACPSFVQLKNDVSATVERKNKRSDSNAVLDIAENERQVSKIAKDVRKKPPPSLFHTVEHWQDVMQYDLFPPNDLAKGLAVSKEQWVKAFDKLDINGDGEIDGDDLDVVHENQALSHLNVSQDHYRLAVAQLVKQFPEFADFTIMHEPILVFFAETNASVPDDAPVPDGKSMALFEARKRKSDIALLEEANSCGEIFGGFVYEMVSFAIKEISGSDLDELLGGRPDEWIKEMANFWNTDNKVGQIRSDMKKRNKIVIGGELVGRSVRYCSIFGSRGNLNCSTTKYTK